MQYKVKEGLTKESLVNTKWNQTEWTIEQKTMWQQKVFSFGYCFLDIEEVNKTGYFFLEYGYEITYCEESITFDRAAENEKHFSDVFDTIEDEDTSADDVLIINEEHLEKVGLQNPDGVNKILIPSDLEMSGVKALNVQRDFLGKVSMYEDVGKPTKSVDTSWTDSHYDNYYILTEEDIEEGKLRVDAYFVNRMWKLNSFDDTGCAFHSLKTYARMANNKNTLERELNALNGQLKRWAKLSGVKLES